MTASHMNEGSNSAWGGGRREDGGGRPVMSSELLRVKALVTKREAREETVVARDSLDRGTELGNSAVNVFRE